MNNIINGMVLTTVTVTETETLPNGGIKETVKVYQHPSDAQETWVPCSKKLPPCGTVVLVTIDNGEVATGNRRDASWGEWCIYGGTVTLTDAHVLAWKPLPKPWSDS